jgi:acyl-CoA dehydrogenase
VDLSLTPAQLDLQARARAYVVDHLQPIEDEFERAGGRLPAATRDELKRAAIGAGLHGGSFPPELGGQGWTVLEQVLVHEQLGPS